MTVHHELLRPAPDDELIERDHAEGVLRRAGFSRADIYEVLAGIVFPAPLSAITLRGQQFGISTGSLVERLGGSP